ncbi:MAG: hypothetical protein MI976_14325 [Pseudomonadales bacterium]|nr:hypothetical protein [Pseudomonadales bacterium]
MKITRALKKVLSVFVVAVLVLGPVTPAIALYNSDVSHCDSKMDMYNVGAVDLAKKSTAQENAAEDCCESDCQCPVFGCVLGSAILKQVILNMVDSRSLLIARWLSVIPNSTISPLYRPPIN